MEQKGSGLDDEARKEQSLLLKLGRYVAIGLEFPSAIVGGILLGYLLDLYFDTSPWLAISLTTTAFVGACIRLAQWVRRFPGEGQ